MPQKLIGYYQKQGQNFITKRKYTRFLQKYDFMQRYITAALNSRLDENNLPDTTIMRILAFVAKRPWKNFSVAEMSFT